MQDKYPLVSIITVNWNQMKVTCELLESLQHLTYPAFEIIVVDNASEKEDANQIKKLYPNINLVLNATNAGFAGGNNAGLRVAKGKYFLFLNNDTEVEPEFLHPLVKALENNIKVGIASPKIRYYHNRNTIQYAGCSAINPYTGRGNFVGHGKLDQGQYDSSHETHFAHGAAMLTSRKIVKEIGLMADLFFLYYEELDYCERVKQAGYTIQYVANSLVYHKESITVGKENAMKVFYMTRNRLLFMRRNFHGFPFWISLFFLVLFSVPKSTLRYLRKFKPEFIKALYRGIIWNICHYDVYDNPKSLET